MSISHIRQRKLFKSKQHNLTRLLTEKSNSEDQRQQHLYFKTQISEHRESYSSRPTLHTHQQPNNVLRQVAALENRINKQQEITHQYFQQFECIDKHYQTKIDTLRLAYDKKIEQVNYRIHKQQQRNQRAEQRKQMMIRNLLCKLIRPQKQKQKVSTNIENYQTKKLKSKETLELATRKPNLDQLMSLRSGDLGVQLLQMIQEQLMRRKTKDSQDGLGCYTYCKQQYSGRNKSQDTFDFALCPTQQERQSESILLDDSLI